MFSVIQYTVDKRSKIVGGFSVMSESYAKIKVNEINKSKGRFQA